MTAVGVISVEGRRVDCDGFATSGGGREVLVGELVPDELLTASHGRESRESTLHGVQGVELGLDALAEIVATGSS